MASALSPKYGGTGNAGAMGAAETPPPLEEYRGPLPIVVGVTGHRDIRPGDIAALSARVAEVFATLASTYPSTPLLLLSALAAGADRIVARVAMEQRFRIPVVVPMPLERAEYEKDFDDEERTEFAALLARAHCHYFVGYAPENDAQAVTHDHAARDRQYAQVGSYIARNSQVLIAFWNGLPSSDIGGTAAIVKFKREGVPPGFGPERRPLDLPENGPVDQIVTPRASQDVDSVLGGSPMEHVKLPPIFNVSADVMRAQPDAAKVTKAIFQRINCFNQDALRIGLVGEALSARRLSSAADQLATFHRNKTLRTLAGLYLLAATAAVALSVYAHSTRHFPIALGSYIVVSAGAIAWYLYVRHVDLQNRYQDYRVIAEGLRVQQCWQRANIGETVADHYLRPHRGELDWIRNAIRTCRILDEAARSDDRLNLAIRKQRLSEAYREWVEGEHGQLAFLHSRIIRNEQSQTTWKWIAIALFAGSLLGAVVALRLPPNALLIIGIVLTAVYGGLAQGYSNICAYGEHAKHYRRVRGAFGRAKLLFTEVLARDPFGEQDYVEAQLVLTDLGEEALAEHAAWVFLHRERPIEYPHSA